MRARRDNGPMATRAARTHQGRGDGKVRDEVVVHSHLGELDDVQVQRADSCPRTAHLTGRAAGGAGGRGARARSARAGRRGDGDMAGDGGGGVGEHGVRKWEFLRGPMCQRSRD